MTMLRLIGLMREYVFIEDGIAHGAAMVALASDVGSAVVKPGHPALTAEGTMFTPLCDQFDNEGPLDTYDTEMFPAIRYAETAGDGRVTCMACLAIHLDEWFPPETEFAIGADDGEAQTQGPDEARVPSAPVP